MNYYLAIILHCINRFSGERSAAAVYYLLKGKRSSQTIQDAGWYNLRNLYQSYPTLTKGVFDEALRYLQEENYIETASDMLVITPLGKQQLRDVFESFPIPKYLEGWKYHQIDALFWQRLSLLVQTLAHWAHNSSSFYPVQRNLLVQQWVKGWIHEEKRKFEKSSLTLHFYKELENVFNRMEADGVDPAIMVYRFSGFEKTGLTPVQISERMILDESYYALYFRSSIHYMITVLWKDTDEFPLLSKLLSDQPKQYVLTQSTLQSYVLLNEGKSIEQIAKIRNLKTNTVEDHIVEMALHIPDFSVDKFVEPALQREIANVIKGNATRKLRAIKEKVPQADYFSIRLVLSKWADIEKHDEW